jgi:hypothetical protein
MTIISLVVGVAMSAFQETSAIKVTVVDPKGIPIQNAIVVAEPDGEQGDTRQKVMSSAGTNPALVKLGAGSWNLRAVVDERWGWPAQVFVEPESPQAGDVTLTVWPLGTLTGLVRAGPRQAAVGELRLRLKLDRGVQPASFPASFRSPDIDCATVKGAWSCRVPAGPPLDIRLDVPGMAPRYLWNVRVPPVGVKDVGALEMFSGASVTGWVVSPAGVAPPAGAIVELKSAAGAPIVGASRTASFAGRTTSRGFFQIGPAPAGPYQLAASQATAASSMRPVELVKEREEKLRTPLVLTPPATLRVSFEPKVSPLGSPWLVRLLQPSTRTSVLVEKVSPDGLWSRSQLPPTEYRLVVMTTDGSVWHQETLDLQSGGENHVVSLRMQQVTGSVSLGESPLPARVHLMGARARIAVWLESDEAGTLSGYVPALDTEATDWVAEVESSAPVVKHRISRLRLERVDETTIKLDLKLPGGVLKGKVVDENGNPQEADVHAMRVVEESDRTTRGTGEATTNVVGRTDEATGRFSIVGLLPGPYNLVAMGRGFMAAPEYQSAVLPARVEKSDPKEVTLILKRAQTTTGRVLAGGGSGVPGAQVIVTSPTSQGVPFRPQTTDADGRFSAYLPGHTDRVAVTVAALGLGRRSLGRNVVDGEPVEIQLHAAPGALLIDLTDAASEGAAGAYIYHDGGFDVLPMLQDWSRRSGEVQEEGLLRAPLMDPGDYRLCRLANRMEFAAFIAGSLPPEKCAEGVLVPGGELRLKMPSTPPTIPTKQE